MQDAVAQSGTHPALLSIVEMITNKTLQNEEAAHVISILPQAALIPTADYLDDFFVSNLYFVSILL